ncbi:MAG: T9SS type A sorting domain-containing protein [Bacteroidia bacterium]|nr:T9SS type A sorting domain-containing protein [Bacteroidia bacterium]
MRKFLLAFVLLFGSTMLQAQAQPKLGCATDVIMQEQLKNNPELVQAQKFFEKEFSKFKETYNAEDYKVSAGLGKKGTPKYIIPVVVHIFHSNGSENLSDAQVINTINNMNKYFNGTIPGIFRVRSIFKNLIADCEIEFRLAKKDPNGNCTNGIIRKYTPQTYRGNDLIKSLSTWDTRHYMNIWVTNAVYSGATAVGGYAYLPFGSGKTSLNGVILVASQFISDNTGAHEAGHWLGLYHPFQTSDSCSTTNDEIEDTPPTYFKLSNNGINSGRGDHCSDTAFNTCTSSTPINTPDLPDQQENVMDYFSGSCSGLMFTLQQKARMIFALENFRKELITPENLVATGTNDATLSDCAPIGAFNTKSQTICSGGSASFFDFSYNASQITSWNWEFTGGTPSTFTGKTPPQIVYNQEGIYPVKLTVANAKGTQTTTLADYIKVMPATANKVSGWQATADWWYLNNWQQEGWRFESEYSSNTFQRVQTSYNNIAGMLLLQDPGNFKNSIANNFSLISPSFNFQNSSSPYFAFTYAFARGVLFNSPTDESVTLFTSIDCGKTWLAKVANSGANASTIGISTLTSSINFIPSEQAKWKEVVYQGANFPKVANLMFKITFKYQGGNNFYLDYVRAGDGIVSGIVSNDPSQISFSVYPNPVTGMAAITYEIKVQQHVNLELYDLLGKHITTLYNGVQTTGNQSIVMDKNILGLTSGVYLIKMQGESSSTTRKIVIE